MAVVIVHRHDKRRLDMAYTQRSKTTPTICNQRLKTFVFFDDSLIVSRRRMASAAKKEGVVGFFKCRKCFKEKE